MRRSIAIGFSDQAVALSDLPGWTGLSWGYHGDDGKFRGEGGEKKNIERFTTGDVIGLGLNRKSHSIYITKNGKHHGTYQPHLFNIPVFEEILWANTSNS